MADPTPDTARRFTKTVADLYADAVTTILEQIADRIDRGLDLPEPLVVKAVDLLALRAQAQGIAAQVSDQLDDLLADTVGSAYASGVQRGADELAKGLGYRDAVADRKALNGLAATQTRTVRALAGNLSGLLRDLPIARAAEDAYRYAVTQGITPAAAGVETRRQAAQRALDRLAMQGIGGHVDDQGRRWRVESYVEMATRTTLGQAQTQGAVDRIRQTTPFGQVSDTADECEVCRPWEGKVLLLVAEADIPAEYADVAYDGTLREARAAGLFHPNCTHAVSGFIPGLTRRRQGRANPAGDKARQEQRRLERGLRDWRRRQAVAITPQARASAAAKAAEWSARIDEHVTRTNRLRLRQRERLTGAR